MYEIPRHVRCKNREKYTLKKNNHTQDSIYVIRQFAYVHGVIGISLFSENLPLKIVTTLFGSGHNPNQTQLDSTKPNMIMLDKIHKHNTFHFVMQHINKLAILKLKICKAQTNHNMLPGIGQL